MTNFEKIKNMTIKEVAKTFCEELLCHCKSCIFEYECNHKGEGIKRWLESEASTEDKGRKRNESLYNKWH